VKLITFNQSRALVRLGIKPPPGCAHQEAAVLLGLALSKYRDKTGGDPPWLTIMAREPGRASN